MERKDKYLLTLALATLTFFAGLWVGYAITASKVAQIEQMANKLKFDLMSLELEAELTAHEPCGAIPKWLEEELGKVAIKIASLEDQLGKHDVRVIELKKYYSLLQIRHWLFMQQRKQKCAEGYSLILFFYSNKPDYIRLSEKQGYVLDYLRNEYGLEKVKVYSLDYDLELGVIQSLIKSYNITAIPSLVIDGSLYSGFHGKEELEKLFE